VKSAHGSDDFRFTGGGAGKFNGGLIGFGPGVAEKTCFSDGGDSATSFSASLARTGL